MNHVTFDGFLGKDPGLKYTGKDRAICSFSVGITDKWQKDGQDREATSWVDVTLWGKKAEAFKGVKGDRVLVVGKLKQDTWKSKDGSNRSKLTVTAEEAAVVWTKQQIPLPMNDPGPHAPWPPPPEDDDLPF